MLRTVIRAVGITFATVTSLALVVEAQSRRRGTQEASSEVRIVGGPVTVVSADAAWEPATKGGVATPLEALRALLHGDAAPVALEGPTSAAEPPLPEGLEVHRGAPAPTSGVRVNRGLP
jgi:hypothetical protein